MARWNENGIPKLSIILSNLAINQTCGRMCVIFEQVYKYVHLHLNVFREYECVSLPFFACCSPRFISVHDHDARCKQRSWKYFKTRNSYSYQVRNDDTETISIRHRCRLFVVLQVAIDSKEVQKSTCWRHSMSSYFPSHWVTHMRVEKYNFLTL